MIQASRLSFVDLSRSAPAAMALPVGIFALFTLMVLPIPTLMLDMFFVLNIAIAVAVLMVCGVFCFPFF